MIKLVQAGQAGKTRYLFEMHRFRKAVFKDRLDWDVQVDANGFESDEFDLPEALYLLAIDQKDRVVGSWRLLPTSGPTMIRDVWPDFLQTLPMPASEQVWEASRFGVRSFEKSSKDCIRQLNIVTAEMFCALTELCLLCGIQQIYTLYDHKIARLLKRLDCQPVAVSREIRIDDIPAQIGCFNTDEDMLMRLRSASGLHDSLLDTEDLPPVLLK